MGMPQAQKQLTTIIKPLRKKLYQVWSTKTCTAHLAGAGQDIIPVQDDVDIVRLGTAGRLLEEVLQHLAI